MSMNMGGMGGGMGNKIPPGAKVGQMQNFSPEQMQLFQSLFSQVGPDSFLLFVINQDSPLIAGLTVGNIEMVRLFTALAVSTLVLFTSNANCLISSGYSLEVLK